MPRASQRPRLGRGLSSLIRNSAQTAALGHYEPEPASDTPSPQPAPPPLQAARTVMLAVDQIQPNPYQPRRAFDENALAELAESLRGHGLLQPILVAPVADEAAGRRYQLIAGERRLRAAELAGVRELPCILRDVSQEQMLELAVVENLHRTDLNPIERASAYRDLIDRFGLTQQQVAERVRQARASVANHLRLLDLCQDAQAATVAGQLSFGHAKVLAGLAGQAELQAQLTRQCLARGLSVRQLEELTRAATKRARRLEAKEGQAPPGRPPYLADVESQLTQALGTKVSVRPARAKNAGKIIIEYYSLEDFDRVTERLGVTLDS